MRVLLAFDKFKDALSAAAACAVAADALRTVRPDWQLDLCPLTDGGEGFVAILTGAARGRTQPVVVTGPRGAPVEAGIGWVTLGQISPAARTRLALPASTRDDALLAVVEMAAASGLALLAPAERDPWQTTTAGTGGLIRAASEAGAAAILLGVGGSATNDLGFGALAALGLELRSSTGATIAPAAPARWSEVARIDGAPAAHLPPILIACDVTNPLLGPQGCAAVYGPQKGLSAADLPRLESESARLARMLCAHAGRPVSSMDTPGAGAAGGIAFGLMVAAGALLRPGFDLVADWLDLDRRIAAADLVLTGEGRFDDSSLQGKGPGAVVARARAAGRPVRVFAGSIATSWPSPGGVHAITPAGWPLEKALAAAPGLLRAAVQREFS